MEQRTVYCNNCPALVTIYGTWPCNTKACAISNYTIDVNNINEYYQDYEDCPLKRLELKDGTIFEPEVIDG